jgi:hypothetical protein
VRDGQTSPNRPRLVVSRSTCPPLFPLPPSERLCNRYCSNKHTPGYKTNAYHTTHTTYRRNRQVDFLLACMSTCSNCILGEFLRILSLLANEKTDDYFETLGYQPHK